MKIFKKAIILILSLVLALACFGCGADKDEVESSGSPSLVPEGDAIMKVGVLSDPQLEEGDFGNGHSQLNAEAQFERALNHYKNIGVKAMFFMGDVVNNAKDSSYNVYNRVLNKVFPDKATRPEIIFNLGNHERYTGEAITDDLDWTTAQFKKHTGQELMVHKKIGGYSFITIPSERYGWVNNGINHSRESRKFLSAEVEKAVAEANGKPVFVGLHEPIAGTVYGDGFTSESAQINATLKKYPNVILFTGHSHFPVADERSIYQKDYTAINTGSCSYCCLGVSATDHGRKVMKNSYGQILSNVRTDGSFRPRRNEYSGIDSNEQGIGLVVTLYKNVTVVERRNFNTDKQIGQLWSIPVNPKTEDFIYTDARYENYDNLPTWDENHEASINVEGKLSVNIKWNDAHWGSSPVETYQIDLVDYNQDKVVRSVCIVSDYYAGQGESKYQVTLGMMNASIKHEVRITPYDCFHHKGEPLILSVPTTGA